MVRAGIGCILGTVTDRTARCYTSCNSRTVLAMGSSHSSTSSLCTWSSHSVLFLMLELCNLPKVVKPQDFEWTGNQRSKMISASRKADSSIKRSMTTTHIVKRKTHFAPYSNTARSGLWLHRGLSSCPDFVNVASERQVHHRFFLPS